MGKLVRAAVALGLMTLAGCGGGGSAMQNIASTTPVTTTSTSTGTTTGTTTTATTSPPTIEAVNPATFGVSPTVGPFPTNTGSTPNFYVTYPANGTVFPLLATEEVLTNPSYAGSVYQGGGGATLTLTGTQTVNGAPQGVFELKDPAIAVDATNLTGNGTAVTLADGRQLSFAGYNLNYSLYAVWATTGATTGQTTPYIRAGISGYQTPATGVPKTGSATYLAGGASTGLVSGVALTPSSTGTITTSTLQGQGALGVDFSTGAINGTFTGMTVTPAGGTATAWNNVIITAGLNGSTIVGKTSALGSPSSASTSFDASSTGSFNGALFGPNGQELGAVWTLNDPTGQGKTAFGVVGAAKQ